LFTFIRFPQKILNKPMLFCSRLHQIGLKPIQDGNLEPLFTYTLF
jgi:hypothetical protein